MSSHSALLKVKYNSFICPGNEGIEVQLHSLSPSSSDESEWSISFPGRFTLRNKTLVSTEQEAGLAPEIVWTLWRIQTPLAPAGVRTLDRPASTDYAAPAGVKTGDIHRKHCDLNGLYSAT